MTHADFVFFDAGGGHRSAATALCEVIERKKYPLRARMVNLQELLDPIDITRRLMGVRVEDVYNFILKNGWTLGSDYLLPVLQGAIRLYHKEQVEILCKHWKQDHPDLVVSMVPHFNRALKEGLAAAAPGTPFVTILTDIADYPPHFWIERQEQFFICGSEKAVEQARHAGARDENISRTSGMILHPRFYEPVLCDRKDERLRLGLDPELPTGLVMFGGQGSEAMLNIASQLDRSDLKVQMIYICGRNQKLADRLRHLHTRFPNFVEGFTKEIPYYMHLSDFFIGKPGPGSISEALQMKLPVIVQENAYTLPQERYNTQWVREKQVGVVVKSFRNIAAAVGEFLQGETLSRYRSNAVALNNRAVFEIPELLQSVLRGENSARSLSSKNA